MPPLNEYLQKKSGRYYKKGVPKEKVVPLASVVVPPLNQCKRSMDSMDIPWRISTTSGLAEFPEKIPSATTRKKEEYEKVVKCRQIERERRHRENRDNGPNRRELERR